MKRSDPRVAAVAYQAACDHRALTRIVTLAIGMLGTGIICLYVYLFP
jgi:hypothetical protein